MPLQVSSNYSTNFQKFVDFANKAYATKGEDTVVRFTGMPKGDYKGTFASFLRTSEMKTANDQVRDLFLKSIADMFGGERNIPDIVRDNMRLEDFGKGKPLTARRINLVRIAIDTLGGGKFSDGASVEKAHSMGYMNSELPKLARVANIYQQATGCTDAEAENAALDPSSKARKLYDYGGRFVKNADSFKAGLGLMDKFAAWYGNLMDDCAAKKLDTPTKLNLNFSVCTREADAAVQKFVFEEIAVNGKISFDAKNSEDLFGMAKNPAMRFVGRGYTTSFSNSLAQIPPEKRGVIYAVFDALDKLPANAGELAKRDKVGYSLLVAARVMKNFDAVAALQASGKLDRAHLVTLLYPDLNVSSGDSNRQISSAYETRVARDPVIMPSLHMLAENSGATLDEADAAISSGTRLENAPGISSFSGKLEEMDGTARGGRKTMIYDLVRPTTPNLTENDKPALADENVKFVFNFPGGETIDTITGSLDDPWPVRHRSRQASHDGPDQRAHRRGPSQSRRSASHGRGQPGRRRRRCLLPCRAERQEPPAGGDRECDQGRIRRKSRRIREALRGFHSATDRQGHRRHAYGRGERDPQLVRAGLPRGQRRNGPGARIRLLARRRRQARRGHRPVQRPARPRRN